MSRSQEEGLGLHRPSRLEEMSQGCHTGGRTQALPETPGHNAFSVLMAAAHIAVPVITVIQFQPCIGLKPWVICKSLLRLRKTPCLSAWALPNSHAVTNKQRQSDG